MAILQCMDANNVNPFEILLLIIASIWQIVYTVADFLDRFDAKHSNKSSERESHTIFIDHAKVFQVIDGRNVPYLKK